MSEPPVPGSPMESLMLLVWRARQDVQLQGMRSLVNAIIVAAQPERQDADKTLGDVWNDFRNAMFPYMKIAAQNQDQAALDYLRKEVARGPLRIKPLAPLTARPSRRSRRRTS
jgi:hypothetical protein